MKKYILTSLVVFLGFIFQLPSASAMSSDYTYQYHRELQHGSSGNDVVTLEFCLARLYDNYYDIDGYFDSRTKNILRDFQSKNNLRVDGILGYRTGAALMYQCNEDNNLQNFHYVMGSHQNPKNHTKAPVQKSVSKKAGTSSGTTATKTNTASQKVVQKKNISVKKANKVQENTHIQTDFEMSEGNKKAEAKFSFLLKNTTSKEITIHNINDFEFSLNEKVYRGDELSALNGIQVGLYNKDKKLIEGNYILKQGEKERFYIAVSFDGEKITQVDSPYHLRITKLNWHLGSRAKVLPLGRSVKAFSLKK